MSAPSSVSFSEKVAEHYNSRPDRSRKDRNQSKILHLKNFNNWVKSVLINKFCNRNDCVLDIGGGKGGDLMKWKVANISHLVLADIAKDSVLDAQNRYEERSDMKFTAKFIVADCCQKDVLKKFLPKDFQFDLVSCQFSLHYSFENEEKARNFVENAAKNLKPGGYFIGTIPNAYCIV